MISTIHSKIGTGDKSRKVRGKEKYRLCDILRGSKAAQRGGLCDGLLDMHGRVGGVASQHESRRDHVDPDPLVSHLDCEVSRKACQGGGRCHKAAVALHGVIDLGGEDIDDGAAPLFAHKRHGLPATIECSSDHHVDLFLMLLPGRIFKEASCDRKVGVIDQDIEAAEPLFDKFEKGHYGIFIRYIHSVDSGSTTLRSDGLAGLLRAGPVFVVVDDDGGVCPCQAPADRLADIIAPARDEGNFPLKINQLHIA